MTFPNFLILGAQKSGTSWLAEMLAHHPDVYMAPQEIHFFDKGENFDKGEAWYANHFRNCGKAKESGQGGEGGVDRGVKRIGEKTPDYFAPDKALAEDHQPGIHTRIHTLLPDARFILVLREPALRAVSAVQHLIRTKRANPLLSIDSLLVGKGRRVTDPHGVIEYGYYMQHLERFLERYSRDRFLILIYEEDVVGTPAMALRRTCDFLGIDASFTFEGMDSRVNPMRGSRAGLAVAYYMPRMRKVVGWLDRRLEVDKRRPKPETMAELKRLYAPENERLFKFLGRRIPAWE